MESRNETAAISAGKKTALIAMSGGVDSSVTAHLMQKMGYTCKGVTMVLFHPDDIDRDAGKKCCSPKDLKAAAMVARKLGMPFDSIDIPVVFAREVIDRFTAVYEAGGTPNPCIECNRTMKFEGLMAMAEMEGIDVLATGHYARVTYDEEKGRWLLKKGRDQNKDQSYVLYMLTQEQLSRLVLPLGDLTKTEVRAIAEEQGFVNAKKQESQDICFVPDGDYASFMESYTGRTYPGGSFLDTDGNVIGTHRGAVRYTKGQRKGLGLAMGTPVYVLDKSMEENTVTVGPEAGLFEHEALLFDVNFIAVDELKEPMRVTAMTRYRKKEAAATIYPISAEDAVSESNPNGTEGSAPALSKNAAAAPTVRIVFDEPQRAMTPGQAVVFYDGDTVVGGGTILSTRK